MTLATEEVCVDNLSEGWLRTLDLVSDTPGRKLFQTVTRISNPGVEDRAIRLIADRLAHDLGYHRVNTVANTIFPAALAAASTSHENLAERYLAMYARIRHIDRNNGRGTYFGRLVAHPNGPDGTVNQLASTIAKLRSEGAKLSADSRQGPKSARYEIAIETPGDQADPDSIVQDEVATDVDGALASTLTAQTYAAGRDNSIMAFPCLSFCSFQLDQGSLHLIAQYRAQSLVERGYGNYLGLARLQHYVAAQTGLRVGGLMVVAGRADAVGASKFAIRKARAGAASVSV